VADFGLEESKLLKAKENYHQVAVGAAPQFGGFTLLVCLEISAVKALKVEASTSNPAEKLLCKFVSENRQFMSIRMQAFLRGSIATTKLPGRELIRYPFPD
jgi:hypothetical protein